MKIVGASFNDPSANAAWVEDQNYEYEVWTDDDKTLAVYYGSVKSSLSPIPGRVTMILDEDGDLLLEYISDTGSSAHPQEVLEDCQALFGSEP